MQKLVIVTILAVCFAACSARPATTEQATNNVPTTAGLPYYEEVIVESSLNVKKKDPSRPKRQFGGGGGFGPYGQSSSLANANSYGQYQGPGGFGSSAGIAGAQGFQSHGPQGGFGASATNAGTQGFGCGYQGCQGSAGMSGTQTYNLPGGKNLNLSYGGAFSNANGAPAVSNTHGITYSK